MATEKVTIDAIDSALRTLGSNGKECGDCDCDCKADGLAKQLIPLVDKLDERRKLVVVQRYGLQGEEPKTLQAIGDQLNRTRERIRQIQNMGLTKLQEMLQNG